MEVLNEYGQILLILAIIFGVFMAWGVGANDVANAMGTSVGSGAITLKQAIIIAMIFEFAGAYLAGGEVTATIRKGIIDPLTLQGTPEYLVYGMLSALLAAGTWLLIASILGWPVSTTHSIVGAIVGFAAVAISVDAVNWSKVGTIAASWIVSPVLAGTISYMLFKSVQRLILDTEAPFENAKRYVPVYMFMVGFMITMVTLIKGLKHVLKDIGFTLNYFEMSLVAAAAGILVSIVGGIMLTRVKRIEAIEAEDRFANVEKVFAVLMVFTACAMAFAHGSNDVANAVGPMAAAIATIKSGAVTAKSSMPAWILLVGGVGIVIGLVTYGYKVMATIGTKITELTPSRGFAATLGASATVVLASGIGLPISTTHTLVGAVLGVGLARGLAAINLRIVATIFTSWVITLPAGAILAIIFFYIFKAIFS
ncbi:inorganic phosphate transporter [Candidatus Njordibacter sp. Uisw_056]|jgi:PiT family inorganic phosphate transporter|uniref:inorganic phosphate transporter n=1 Tax=Candidatus Njordibacter sp. Uisw_056 TaxID=3230973 RepID=UPI003D4304D6|tara:strand:- start:5574 stop:6848 length:1275 start_codon:yes stop_codon:yes gene_type:complete